MVLLKIQYGGFEPMTQLLPVAVFEDGNAPLIGDEALALLLSPMQDGDVDASAVASAVLDDGVEEAQFVARADVDGREQQRFEEAISRIERSIDDRVLVLRRTRTDLAARLEEARHPARRRRGRGRPHAGGGGVPGDRG